MASMGAQLDVPRGNAPYCFRIHGQVYHYAGPLHPAPGQKPTYGQIYIMDTAQAAQERLGNPSNVNCNPNVMRDLGNLLSNINQYARSYRMMYEVLQEEEANAAAQGRPVAPVKMVFDTTGVDRRRYNDPTCSEVAVVYVGEDSDVPANRHLAVHPRGGTLTRISDIDRNVDPLTYPIFFPTGKPGWYPYLLKRPSGRRKTRISQKEYYSFLIQVRAGVFNPLHRGGSLFQQYIVDAWVKTEQNRLNYIRTHQSDLRSDNYNVLQDFLAGDNDGPPGKRVVLPSSVQGSPRAMVQDYQDAMAIVAKYGKPDYFVTFTCNPKWKEIEENLLPGQTASDRPDLVARVFHLKMNALLADIRSGVSLGRVRAYVSIYEWQKRGLPHTHSLFIMEDADKPRTPDDVNNRICAELPDNTLDKELFDIVSTAMIHRPCGVSNPNSPCMRDGECSKKYPKDFRDTTSVELNGYPLYRRRDDNRYVMCNGQRMDNRSVVPYNPGLLRKYKAHINVEICALIEAVKYLYKYVYKGPDRASLRLQRTNAVQNSDGQVVDEIQNHLDARYVCAPEAIHHLLGFSVEKKSDTVCRLAVHLPNSQNVTFRPGQEREALQRAATKHTTLTAWFHANAECKRIVESGQIPAGFLDSRNFNYPEMPRYFTFNNSGLWSVRQRGQRLIGRMYTVSPREPERYALRQLLLRVKGACSWEDLRTTFDPDGNRHVHDTFMDAARAHGIFDDDTHHIQTLQEAAHFNDPAQLRGVFVATLAFMEVACPFNIWNAVKRDLAEDFRYQGLNDDEAEAMAYYDIEDRLIRNNLRLSDFNIPAPRIGRRPVNIVTYDPVVCRIEGDRLYATLNQQQKEACDAILTAADDTTAPRLFFIDGPGGSGKTYLYSAVFNLLTGRGLKVQCTAWTGIAANLLPSGRTSASLFKLDINNQYESSSHKRTGMEARLLGENDAIIWDEASMIPKKAFETADAVLRDITQILQPFGGKIVILGGDFRQVLPVVRRGSREEQVDACIKRSLLWNQFITLHLTSNMRVTSGDTEWIDFLLSVGNGTGNNRDGQIILPPEVMGRGDIVKEVFGETVDPTVDLTDKAILAPKNIDVDILNGQVHDRMIGEERMYLSSDEAVCEENPDQLFYTTELLNNINLPGLPPHRLCLKRGSIVMLLRNLDVTAGLCNGTRLEVLEMGNRVLQCRFAVGSRKGQKVLIPRIVNYDDKNLPFKLKRAQFPVRLAYALSINKAQGQSFSRIGLWLSGDVFAHGQLYVALSRVRSRQGLTVQSSTDKPLNVVYEEVL